MVLPGQGLVLPGEGLSSFLKASRSAIFGFGHPDV
jgi:hypothetical protein